MRAPLAVRINDGVNDRIFSRPVSGLRFRKTAPGGHHSASMTLSLPRDTFTQLGPADRIDISDGRTGTILWSGYTDNPGSTDGTSGQSFELSAMGGMTLTSDQSERLIYLDRTYDEWRGGGGGNNAPSALTEVRVFPEGATLAREDFTCLYLQLTPGQPVTSGSQASMIFKAFETTPMTIGAVIGWFDSGITDANYLLRMVAGPFISGDTRIVDTTPSGTGSAVEAYAGTGFPTGKTSIQWFLRRNAAATNIATDTVWSGFSDLAIFAHFLDRDGNDRDPTDTSNVVAATATDKAEAYVLASDIAEDLLGRILLQQCDSTTAEIEATSTQIDQLAYREGATPARVFEDLELYEPDFYWGIGERLLNDKHRFWYRQWPTDVRYEISTKDGYQAPGADFDLCNRIAVSWTDEKGVAQTTVRTATVEELDAVGRTRDAESITLPDGLGSQSNAELIGDAVLAAKADPPKAATAVVRRPLVDLSTGITVMPWELEPGYLVRVRETGDLLRLTEVEYVDDDCSATLTLGEPTLTTDQRLARLQVEQRRR